MNKFLFRAFILLFFASYNLFSQEEITVKKSSFALHCTNPAINLEKYENALNNYGQLDQFRLYDKRRTMSFKNTTVLVELFSAKELLDTYGKEISPFTIKKGAPYKEIDFVLTMDEKSVKPQLK